MDVRHTAAFLDLLAVGCLAQIDVLDRCPIGAPGGRLPRLFQNPGNRLEAVAAIAVQLADLMYALDFCVGVETGPAVGALGGQQAELVFPQAEGARTQSAFLTDYADFVDACHTAPRTRF